MAVAENLKRERERQGLTQQQLAVAADLSVLTVSRTERGATMPDLDTLKALAAALDLPIASLLSECEDEPNGKSAVAS